MVEGRAATGERPVDLRHSHTEVDDMDQAALVTAVQDTARLKTHHEAEQAVRAVLSVLGERVGGAAGDLAAQLPGSLKDTLPGHGDAERFGADEFCRRVAERGPGNSAQDGRRHAKAVLAGVRAAVAPGAFAHVVDQLPADYQDLVGAGPVKH